MTKQTEQGNYGYDHDDLYRLTDVDNPTLSDEAYNYDLVGNRLTASGVSGSIEHNANNELGYYGDISYDYDANGNMVSKSSASETRQYIYNVQNRLVRVEDGSGGIIAEYSYDPFGRRLWKVVSGTRTYFFYSHEGLVAEYDENGIELRTYGYRPDSTWTTDPLWLKQNGEYYFYQNDHLGTPQKLVAVNGAVVWSASYTAFGKTDVQIATITNNLLFPGQYFDEETGWYYNYHRNYEPESGRYMSVDPIGFEGGDVNLYVYVWNNPMNRSDPFGLKIRNPEENDLIHTHLATLMEQSPTAELLITLIDRDESVEVKIIVREHEQDQHFSLEKNTIVYRGVDDTLSDGTVAPAEIILAHELITAWLYMNDDTCHFSTFPRLTRESIVIGLGKYRDFTFTENKIRDELNLESRKRCRYMI